MSDDPNHKKPPADGFTSISDVLPGLFPMMEPRPAEAEATPAKAGRAGAKTPRVSDKLAIAAAQIAARPDSAENAYLARELVQCTLPHRDPGDVPAWVRRNGNFSLVIQPGFDEVTMKPRGLPYGSIPRLLLLWIVTEAVRTRKRHIKLSSSLSGFLREIGLDPNTGRGKRGDAKRLKEQMLRLLDCHISFRYNEGDEMAGSRSKVGMEIAPKTKLWWDFRNPSQGTLFESELELGEEFYNAILANPIPTDFRVLKALKQSSLAIDVYTWLNYRVYRMQASGQAQVAIPVASLQEQFGSEYKRQRDFKAAFEETVLKIREVFPGFNYAIDGTTFILIDGHSRPAIAPRDKSAARHRLAALHPYNQISDKTRQWFKQAHPGLDIEVALQDFDQWRTKNEIQSANTDAHFRSFVKTWVKN